MDKYTPVRTPLDDGSAQHRVLYLYNTRHSQQKNISDSGGIGTHSSSKQATTRLLLGPRGHQDRLISHSSLQFVSMARQPLVGKDLLIVECSPSHSDTPHSVGLLCTSDQPVVESSTCTTHKTHKGQIYPHQRRDSNPQFPASERLQTRALINMLSVQNTAHKTVQ